MTRVAVNSPPAAVVPEKRVDAARKIWERAFHWKILRVRQAIKSIICTMGSSIALAKPVLEPAKPPERHAVRLNHGQNVTATALHLETLEFLGKGGNGSVFRMMISQGEWRGLIVAVKFLEAIGDEQRVKHFEEEIKILKDINHPHVIKILDTGKWYEVPFFVMEYQPRNLERETSAHPRGLHPDAVLPLCLQLASALAHIHAKKIVHRDLKPANVLFDGSNVKLADFGIASLLERSSPVKWVKGKKVGPHFFLSPEQWKWWKEESNDLPGQESDIFQLGLIIMKMLTGYNPNTVPQWEKGKTQDEPKSKLRVYDGSLVNDIISLVREMIEVDPTKRPSASEVQDRLLSNFRAYSSHFSALYGVRPGREF